MAFTDNYFPCLFLEAKRKKETLSPETKLSQEEAKFAKVYKASKSRRKILIEEPEEEEETEDVTIGQFIKGKLL